MYASDKRILRLIDLLIFKKEINSLSDFCSKIGTIKQTIYKIRKGTAHFTVLHIESICKNYDVNANWIYGIDDKVFNKSDSIKLKI